MQVKQIYDLVNEAVKQVLGEETLVSEDLSNLVDLGTQLFNANAVDSYVRTLVDHIGKVVFVNRAYQGGAPKVLMDSWEFGSVVEKIQGEMPDATENETWELQDGASYDPNIFYKPVVSVKFFNSKTTFEVPVSITERQVKMSFSDATQMNSFISMIYTNVENAMTLRIDSLIHRTINNAIAETVYDAYGTTSGFTGAGNTRAVNLLKLYNDKYGTSLTAGDALATPEFIRFASYMMSLYIKRMATMSTLFNVGGKKRFTSKDNLHIVMLDEFDKASQVYLESDTFHNELVKLPNAETISFFQGSGTGYAFADTATIKCKLASDNTKDMTITGILGVMFDKYALGVTNQDRRVTTNYNPKAEFWNQWHKWDCSYFNDLNENFVVFFVA